MKKVVTIGWWTWTYNMLLWLKKIDNIDISAIVSMSDDWWSTGRLRDEYGVLPPWDIRQGLVALSDEYKTPILRDLFNYRFSRWELSGHNLGNLIIMALEDIRWSFWKAIDGIEEILWLRWKIFPVTFEKTRLLAVLENWKYIFGETNIDVPKHDWNLKISEFYVIKEKYFDVIKVLLEKQLWFEKSNIESIIDTVIHDIPEENPKVKNVLDEADYIIIWPWDLYTSILPNLKVWETANHILNSKWKKILMVNLFTKYWETSGYKLSDFVTKFRSIFGDDIFDYIVVQDYEKFWFDNQIMDNYRKENKDIIKIDIEDKRIIRWDFAKQNEMIRHDPDKIFQEFQQILV